MSNMVDFGFTEEQHMFRDVIRKFTQRELAPGAFERGDLGEIPKEIIKKFADAGYLGLRTPEDLGGQGGDFVSLGIAVEETTKEDFSGSFFMWVESVMNGGIVKNPNEELKSQWLPLALKGEKIACFALTEPDTGSDALAIRCKAERDGDHYILNGEKTSVSLGMQADAVIVFAKTGDPSKRSAKAVSAFFVPCDLPGVEKSLFPDMGWKPIGRAAISLTDVRVPVDYRIGGEGEGFYSAMQGFDAGRVFLSIQVLALGEASVYEAIEYAKQRTAFGKPIAKYDAVSFRLVDSLARIEAAKLLAYKALWLLDQGRSSTRETAMVKSIAPSIGIEACNNAMVTLGHVGYSSEARMEQRLRDAYGFEFADGTQDIQRIVMVREFIGREYLNYT